MESSMDEEGYLEELMDSHGFLQLKQDAWVNSEQYLYIHFKDHINRVSLDNLERGLELVADFKEQGLPIGMCPFFESYGEKYMIGGERTGRGPNPEYPWQCHLLWVDDPSDALSSDIFVLNPSTGQIIVDNYFPKPHAPKTNARVLATIDAKVYVISTQPFLFGGQYPMPVFESFNIAEKKWETLLAPSAYDEKYNVCTKYYYHFVVCREIYLYLAGGLYCFNVDDPTKGWKVVVESKWCIDMNHIINYRFIDYDSDFERNEWEGNEQKRIDSRKLDEWDYDCAPFPPAHPYYSVCFTTPGKGGLAVSYTTKGLAGHIFDQHGNVLFQQLLKHHNACLPSPNSDSFGGKVVHVRDDRFCLVLSGRIDEMSWSLGVATFQLTSAMLLSDLLFDRVELRYHQYDDIDSISANLHSDEKDYKFPMLYDYRDLLDAFVMYTEYIPRGKRSKRKRIDGSDWGVI